MQKILLLLMSLVSLACMPFKPKSKVVMNNPNENNNLPTIYEFKVAGLMGDTIDLSQFQGKKILVVNTASKCGLTPQYEGLEKLYQHYKDRLVIIGFPANDFMGQEPGTNEDIQSFCQKNYGVSFPMAAKITLKGEEMAPIYQWLTQKSLNGVMDTEVAWNFQKYLIDENGHLIAYFHPKTDPWDEELIKLIDM